MTRAQTAAACLLMAAIGFCLALTVFPIDFILPRDRLAGPFPLDTAQHIVAQRYFIADAWRWPLLVVPSLGTPSGANIGWTDAIPLLTLGLKAIRGILPPGFHGLGIWYVLCWTAQPVAAIWCLRAAGETRFLPALTIGIVALSIPAWWNRFGHAALCSHFLLTLGLAFYFLLTRAKDGTHRARHWIGMAVLLPATLLIHPYIFVMNAALACAVPLTWFLRRDRHWRAATLGCALSLTAGGIVFWLAGYGGGTGEGGFGHFAMNVLSPIWPAGSWIAGKGLVPIHAEDVSGWEGYNYLGLGLLAGLAIAALCAPRAAVAALWRHAGLVLALLALTALSLSNAVAIGYAHVYRLYPAPPVLEALRSSGRFFWPVTYALAVAAIVGTGRIGNPALRTGLLVLIAAVQFADVTPMRRALATSAAAAEPWTVDAAGLRPMIAAHTSLTILPPWNCLPSQPGAPGRGLEIQILTLASERLIPVNTMYQARWPAGQRCDDLAEAAAALKPGELRLILPEPDDRLVRQVPGHDQLCRPVGKLMACAQ